MFNRSWWGPVRSRFGGEYRYEGIREKTDKRTSIFGRARVATLLSFLITIVIFLSLVVCLETYLILTPFPLLNQQPILTQCEVSLRFYQECLSESSKHR